MTSQLSSSAIRIVMSFLGINQVNEARVIYIIEIARKRMKEI